MACTLSALATFARWVAQVPPSSPMMLRVSSAASRLRSTAKIFTLRANGTAVALPLPSPGR